MMAVLIAPVVSKRLHLPGLLGLICAGTLLGPSVSGLLARDRSIVLLGTIGLEYLMFMAGLSMDLVQFERVRGKSILFGLASFGIPCLLGLLGGLWLLDFSLYTSLLLGAIVGSHTLLAYPIVAHFGIVRNQAVTLTLGATLVTDLVSLGLLAVVTGAASGETGLAFWTRFVLSVLLYLLACWLIIPRLGRWFFRTVKYDSITNFVFMTTILFLSASGAQLAGLAPLIGAFIAGLLLNRLVPEQSTLMSRVQFVGNGLFIPFFLLSVGMLVDVSVLVHGQVWLQALLFTLMVILGKGGSALLVARLMGRTRPEGLVMAGLTIPQAAATLAVTLTGFEIGLFDATSVNAVIILILLSCILGPTLVERFGRQVALQDQQKPYDPSDAPQRILIPLANPEKAQNLMETAFLIHDRDSHEPIYPLAVVLSGGEVSGRVARAESMLRGAVAQATAAEVKVTPLTLIDLNIARGISRAVQENRISDVLIGWNGQITTEGSVFGTILDQLLEESKAEITVCRLQRPVNVFRRVLIALPPLASLEPGFADAIRSTKILSRQTGAEVIFLRCDEGEEQIQKRVEVVKPDVEAAWVSLPRFSGLMAWLREHRRPDDLLIILSARRDSVSWQPTLDRLPGTLAKGLPDLCFLVIFPSEVLLEQSRLIAIT